MSRPIPKDERRKRIRQNSEDAEDNIDPRDVRKRSNFSRDRDGGRGGDRDSRDRDNSRGETKETREAREAMMYVWENRELFVGNILAAGVTEDSLRDYLNRAMKESGLVTPGSEDPIASCRLSGKYGFLEFANANDCTKALNLNGIPFMGSNLKIGRPAKYSGPVKFGITWQQLTSGDPNILNRLTSTVSRNSQGMHPPASSDLRKTGPGGPITIPTGKGFRNIGNVHTRMYREIFIGNTTMEMEDEALKEFLGELLFKLGLSSNGMYHPIMEVKNSGKFAFLITRTIEDCANLLNLSGVPFLGHKLKFERPSRFEGEISTVQYYTWDDVYNTLYLSSELRLMTSVVQNQFSRIVRMINLAPLQDIILNTTAYLELMEDVRNTCSSFGTVKSVIIPRTGATGGGNSLTRATGSGGNGEEGVCKVFVEMSTIPEARAVISAFKGRTFNGRYIDMKMYPEDKFRALNYHYEFPGQILTASHGMVMKEQIFIPAAVQKIHDALDNPKNIVTSN